MTDRDREGGPPSSEQGDGDERPAIAAEDPEDPGDEDPGDGPPREPAAEAEAEAAQDEGEVRPPGGDAAPSEGQPASGEAEAAPPDEGAEAAPSGEGAEAAPSGEEAAPADEEAAGEPPLRLEVVEQGGEPARVCRRDRGYTLLLVSSDRALGDELHEVLGVDHEIVRLAERDGTQDKARLCAPDLVLLDGVDGAVPVLEGLRSDPLTDFIPVLVLVTDSDLGQRAAILRAGATDLVDRRIDPADLRKKVAAAVEEPAVSGAAIRGSLGEATLVELVSFVAREIQRGVLDAAGPGSETLKVQLGRGGDFMGALWAFVARLRDIVDRGAEGRVVFRSLEPGRVDVMALTGGRDAEPIEDEDVLSETIAGVETLEGLRVVVADDDPAVRWAFTTALGEVGMEVEAVANGRSALRAIRADRPDLLITDILMPEMDGWELLRRLRRDLLLRDLPVVVLSWKEDFLQRMQELAAGADEYMLKETDRAQILLGVSRVLAPRRELERRVAADGEVLGRVEAAGIVPLIRAVSSVRQSARLVVRETWNLFELDIERGRIVGATNTTAGGSFTSGSRALGLLLGVQGGRFRVTELPPKVQHTIEGDLVEALDKAVKPVQELLELVAGGAIVRVARVVLRADVVPDYLQVAPKEVRAAIERLADGESPRELILDGVVGPQELERIVLDLVRRGVVETVEAPLAKETERAESPDEERWAVIAGEVPAPSAAMSDAGERVSIPTPMPPGLAPVPPPLPPRGGAPEPEAVARRERRSRVFLYLALVALAVALITRFWGGTEEPEPREARQGAAAVTEARTDPGSSLGSEPEAPGAAPDGSPSVTVLEDIPVELPTVEADAAGAEADATATSAPEERDAGRMPRSRSAEDAAEPPSRRGPESEADRAAPREDGGPREPTPAGGSGAPGTGTLRILAPAGEEPVEVYVNGARRGEAPLTLDLPPGVYSVQFRSGEARSFAAVRITAGETETRTPRMAR